MSESFKTGKCQNIQNWKMSESEKFRIFQNRKMSGCSQTGKCTGNIRY